MSVKQLLELTSKIADSICTGTSRETRSIVDGLRNWDLTLAEANLLQERIIYDALSKSNGKSYFVSSLCRHELSDAGWDKVVSEENAQSFDFLPEYSFLMSEKFMDRGEWFLVTHRDLKKEFVQCLDGSRYTFFDGEIKYERVDAEYVAKSKIRDLIHMNLDIPIDRFGFREVELKSYHELFPAERMFVKMDINEFSDLDMHRFGVVYTTPNGSVESLYPGNYERGETDRLIGFLNRELSFVKGNKVRRTEEQEKHTEMRFSEPIIAEAICQEEPSGKFHSYKVDSLYVNPFGSLMAKGRFVGPEANPTAPEISIPVSRFSDESVRRFSFATQNFYRKVTKSKDNDIKI